MGMVDVFLVLAGGIGVGLVLPNTGGTWGIIGMVLTFVSGFSLIGRGVFRTFKEVTKNGNA